MFQIQYHMQECYQQVNAYTFLFWEMWCPAFNKINISAYQKKKKQNFQSNNFIAAEVLSVHLLSITTHRFHVHI